MKEYKSFYKSVGGNEGDICLYPIRLDTYGCGCSNDCDFCLDGNTDILLYNGLAKKIKDIKIGDELVGVEQGDKKKYFTKSVVTNTSQSIQKAYKITLKNGKTFICSGNHQWLTNRGWKYTIGAMSGEDRRPYITTNNNFLGFETLHDVGYFDEDDEYKKGYLRGIILGDGNLGIYDYSDKRRKKDIQYHFRLALKNESLTMKAKKYLSDFGIQTYDFIFPMKDRRTKEILMPVAIRASKESSYYQIKELIVKRDNENFRRGYLAGIYDAEGSKTDIGIRRVYNQDDDIINEIIEDLDYFGFKYTFDKDKPSKNGTVKTVRLLGGISESLRLTQVTHMFLKDAPLENIALKTMDSSNLQVVKIEELSDQLLYDISTTTRNFIANGCVSHNCYAKSLLSFRGLWNPSEPSVADIEKIKRKINKLPKGMPAIRLGGMTDCFQPIEKKHRVTYETIKALNERGINYLIVTKCDLVASDEYLDILDKDLAHIQYTLTFTDDDLYKKVHIENAPLPSKRIKAIEKLEANGFDVCIRLSPYIPEFIDLDTLNNIKCDKMLVEFLRVNHWIRKWLGDKCDLVNTQGTFMGMTIFRSR